MVLPSGAVPARSCVNSRIKAFLTPNTASPSIGTIRRKDMRDQGLIPRNGDHEMDVRRTKRMPCCCLEHFTNRPVIRYRIESRHDRPEIKVSVSVSSKSSPQGRV